MTNLIVRCINQAGTAHLTIDKEYAVIQETVLDYKVFNDSGVHHCYGKRLFSKVNLPRQHSEEIHAWADGATIQYHNGKSKWYDCHNNEPAWYKESSYRVKPINPNAEHIKHLEAQLEEMLSNVRDMRAQINQLQ